MDKKLVAAIIVALAIIGAIVYWREVATWSREDYQACVDAGGPTAESDPPTCFHPNGDKITPGYAKD